MRSSPHQLILASAGTGKTFRLALRFLELLLAGVGPERVLATTFTRKAAGEVLDRVLALLLEAAESEAGLERLARNLPGRSLSRASCLALLEQLVQRLGELQVRTFDSFFVHLGKLFAAELALPAGWRIAEEDELEELRGEAIAAALDSFPLEERRLLLRSLLRESAARSVHTALTGIVERGFALYRDCEPAAWQPFAKLAPAPREALEELGRRLLACELPRGKNGKPNANWRKAVDKLVALLEQQSWKELLQQTLVQKPFETEPTYYGLALPEELAALLREAGAAAAAELVELAQRETAAARAFLERYAAEHALQRRSSALLSFDDLGTTLAGAGRSEGGALVESELWFRLDGRIDHVLLDEFQDTNSLGWRALAPLTEEILADGSGTRSFFCVGDVKQSIYGWRAAEPRILASLATRYPVLAPPESLTKSYRSSAVVIDTVNRVFRDLAGLAFVQDAERAALGRVAARWHEQFQEHSVAEERAGDARVWRALESEGVEDAVLELTVRRVVALYEAHPDATIGVLYRRNRGIARLLHALSLRGIWASGEGGAAIVDSEAVQVVLSALHLADHPGDSAAFFHVESSPLAAALGWHAGIERGLLARELRARILREGYGGLAEHVLGVVQADPAWSEWDRRRLRKLVELSYRYGPRAGLRPERFARLVREAKVEEQTSSRLRIMTIHKAKGLEFDAVVCPELDQKWFGQGSGYLDRRSDPFGRVDRVLAYVSQDVAPYSPEVAELHGLRDERTIDDALCVLYVALTRAKHSLDLILAPLKKSGEQASGLKDSALLHEALQVTDSPAMELVWRHPEGRDDWQPKPAPKPAASTRATPAELRWKAIAEPAEEASFTPSRPSGKGASAAELLRPHSPAAQAHGSLVHRLLEECRWLEELALDDTALSELLLPLQPDSDARAQALRAFRSALERPAIRALLSRPPQGEWRVENERRFSLYLPSASGRPQHWHGSIDRLVIELDQERPLRAHVIDYKTDAVPTDGVPARAALHAEQLQSYRRAAAQMLGLPEQSVRASLAFLLPGAVIDL